MSTPENADLTPFPAQGDGLAAELERDRFNDLQDQRAQTDRDREARKLRRAVRRAERPAAAPAGAKPTAGTSAAPEAVQQAPAAAPAPADKPIIADGDTVLTLSDIEMLRRIAGNRTAPSSIPPSGIGRPPRHHHH